MWGEDVENALNQLEELEQSLKQSRDEDRDRVIFVGIIEDIVMSRSSEDLMIMCSGFSPELLSLIGRSLVDTHRYFDAENILTLAARKLETSRPVDTDEDDLVSLLAEINHGLGEARFHTGRWDEAVLHYKTALAGYKQPADDVEAVQCLSKLGTLEFERGKRTSDIPAALERLNKALAYFRQAVLTIAPHLVGVDQSVDESNIELWIASARLHFSLGRFFEYKGTQFYRLSSQGKGINPAFHPETLNAASRQLVQAINTYVKIPGLMFEEASSLLAYSRVLGVVGRPESQDIFQRATRILGTNDPNVQYTHALLLRFSTESERDRTKRDALLHEAMDSAIRAWLTADGSRYEFDTEHRRLAWRESWVLPALELALDLAQDVGDSTLIADLIAVSRASGVMSISGDPTTDLALAQYRGEDALRQEGYPSLSASAVASLGLDSLFRRRQVPSLRMPRGRIALSDYHPADPDMVINYF